MRRFENAAKRRLKSLMSSDTGVAAVEFALILPVMLVMLFGTIELDNALNLNRKVGKVATAIADLVTQGSTINNNQLESYFEAGEAIVQPFPDGDLTVVVGAIDFLPKNKIEVVWSKALNGSPWKVGAEPPIDIPQSLRVEGTQIIIAKADYSYKPMFKTILKDVFKTDSIEMSETAYLYPRLSDTVAFQ